jgi:hypothetical protein
LTLSFEGTKIQYGLIVALFAATQIVIQGQCQVKARAILQDVVAYGKIEAFLKNALTKYRHNKKSKKDSIEVLARRIRTQAQRNLKMTRQQRQDLYNHIIAAFIQQAMALHKISITMKEVCGGMGIEYDGSQDEDKENARTARGRAASAAKKNHSMNAKAFSKADLTEQTIRLYTAKKDWTTKAVKKHMRANLKERTTRAEQDTQVIDEGMANL